MARPKASRVRFGAVLDGLLDGLLDKPVVATTYFSTNAEQ